MKAPYPPSAAADANAPHRGGSRRVSRRPRRSSGRPSSARTRRNFCPALVCVKATAEQTGGTMNLFEVTCLPGYATPLHIHYNEDVGVYVLEGVLSILWAVALSRL